MPMTNDQMPVAPHEVVMHTVLAGKPYTWIRELPGGPVKLVKMADEDREALGHALATELGR